jgi:hypothetical protein
MARLCRNGCCWQVFERGWPAKTINRFEVDLRKEELTDERTDGRTDKLKEVGRGALCQKKTVDGETGWLKGR